MGKWGRIAVGGLGIVSTLGLTGPAIAADATVVRGTDLPAGTGLVHVGCTSPFGATGALAPFVGQGPGTPPLGARSLGFQTQSGQAAGPVAYTDSVGDVGTASVSVNAARGTTGVAWVGYQDPSDAGTSTVWFGHATLGVPAGGWTAVSATGLTYTWDQYDATTGAVVAPGPIATVAGFTAGRPAGAGLYALAFGCDGASFNLDAFRFGASTYDFEGLATNLSMQGGGASVLAGETTKVVGLLSATGGARIAHATAILERRTVAGAWETVRVVEAGGPLIAIVEPSGTTTYRWRFVDRPLAEGSTSSTYVVDVALAVTAQVTDTAVTGRVSPGAAGRVVNLRPASGGGVVASAVTSPDGTFSLPLADVEPGSYAVVSPADATHLRGESAPLQVGAGAPVPEPTPTPAPTPTSSPTLEPTPTDPVPTATAEPTPTGGPTRAPSSSPSADPTPTARPSAPGTTGPAPTGQATPNAPTDAPADADPSVASVAPSSSATAQP